MTKQNKVIIISGATATGKTTLAISEAKKYQKGHLQIINFDSLLFYRELKIGTARPTLEEMDGVPHHLIAIQSAKNPINAAQFSQLAREKITALHRQGAIPVLVGGSAFYLHSLLKGTSNGHSPSKQVLEKSHTLYQKEGIHPFLKILQKCDPPNFHKLHKNDHYRIRRAVEYYWSTERPFSSVGNLTKPLGIATQGPGHFPNLEQLDLHGLNLCHLYLHIEKYQHWEIIQQRTEKMIQNGLVEEVSGLYRQGFTGKERPLQSIGYRQAQQYLNKTIPTRKQLAKMITVSTRQLAKAQKTFFSRMTPKGQFNPLEDGPAIFQYLHHFLS